MFEALPDYAPADPSLWQGRKDTTQPERFFQKVNFPQSLSDLTQAKETIFIGFASDVGVQRNQGRSGAKLGPDEIKKQLAKLPCSSQKSFIDLGNIICETDLESAQHQLAEILSFCHGQGQGHRTIVLGGGHEVAWGHFQGLAPHYPKIGIINFDAHFDLRPYEKNQPGTSGTPFSQIAAWCQENNRPFHYYCLGIQNMGNTPSLFQRAHELNVRYLSAEEMNENNLAWQFAFLDDALLNLDQIYLSLCLDVFSEAFAPGVSAPQPLGLTPWQVLPLLKYIIQSGKVISIDVAELSPPWDYDHKTARLAALIVAELLPLI